MGSEHLSSEQFKRIPPRYGSQPIPEGTVRFNHYTSPEHAASIMKHGLQRSKSEEAYSRGGTESPQVFATAGALNESDLHRADYIEGYAYPQAQLDVGSPITGKDSAEHSRWLEDRRAVITARGDIPPEQLLAVHKQWHNHARAIEDSPGTLKDTLAGKNDSVEDDPDYGPAIKHIKQKYGAG